MNDPLIHLFVYGTLKRGYPAHKKYCRNIAECTQAELHGRLYLLPEGYPTMDVPEETILAVGSKNILDDAAKAKWIEKTFWSRFPGFLNIEGWPKVSGEILTLRDPLRSLPAIDTYEDFVPREESLYRRVLVLAVANNEPKPVWAYVVAPGSKKIQLSRASLISQWPPGE